MGISQQIGASSAIKAGVCTSSTRPASPFEGQMIYETDTDMVTIWNGTAWRYIASTTPTNGTVLQVVTGSTSTQAFNMTSTDMDSGLTATITPKSTSSKVLIYAHMADCKITSATAGCGLRLRLYRGTTNIQQFATELGNFSSATQNFFDSSTMFLDSPATTSATTYKVMIASSNNSNGAATNAANSGQSVITLMEIAG
jgi:hypothetical protein